MGQCVIANHVSGSHEFAHDVGALFCIASDHKVRCFRVVASENFQQTKLRGIVGSIVISESELLCSGRETGEGAAVPLARRRHRLIADGDECAGNGRASDRVASMVGL